MHEYPRKAPLPNDPAAHPDAVGRPVDASSRIAFTTSDGQPVEVPLLTLVPIPRLTIDEAAVGFDMEVRSDGSTAVNGRCRTIRKDDGNYSQPARLRRKGRPDSMPRGAWALADTARGGPLRRLRPANTTAVGPYAGIPPLSG